MHLKNFENVRIKKDRIKNEKRMKKNFFRKEKEEKKLKKNKKDWTMRKTKAKVPKKRERKK